MLSFLLFSERVSAIQLMAVALSLFGVAVIVARGSIETLLELSFAAGDGWIFLAVICYAVYSVWLRRRPKVHPLSFIAATFGLGSMMLAPLYAFEHLQVESLRLTTKAIAAILYVALFPSVTSFLFFNRAVELIGASRAAQYLHLMPVFGSALAAMFLGERLAGFHLIGILLIAAGILLARTYALPPPTSPPPGARSSRAALTDGVSV